MGNALRNVSGSTQNLRRETLKNFSKCHFELIAITANDFAIERAGVKYIGVTVYKGTLMQICKSPHIFKFI